MPETVFWDTAAFVALGNARDDLHRAAIDVSQELAQAKVQVLTTDAVLIEVANTFPLAKLPYGQLPGRSSRRCRGRLSCSQRQLSTSMLSYGNGAGNFFEIGLIKIGD